MKKITLFLFLSAFIGFVNATVYLDETFDYADGALKSVTGWSAGGSTTWASDYMVQSPALSYSNAGGTYVLSGQGKIMNCNYVTPYGSTNYTAYKSFAPSSISTGTVYLSFLYSPNGEPQSQSQAPAISMSLPTTNTGVQVWVGKGTANSSHFRFGTTRGSTTGADIKWTTTEYADLNETYLIVLKYDLDTQISYLYVNPEVGTISEPTADASDATSTSNVRTAVQTIQFKTQGSSKEVYVAGSIRVSSTWAEAVAVQSTTAVPLNAPVIGLASNVGAESFTANWTKVDDAIGYTVKVYQGATLVASQDVNDQSTESLDMCDLWVETAYTYTVTAKGDGSDFLNSDESSASTSFSTLAGLASSETNFANTDFWGEAETVDFGLENYPSSILNGYTLNAAYYRDGSIEGFRGNKFQNRFAVDKSTFSGSVTLPIIQSVKQIEIFAASGSIGKSFKLEKTLDGIIWEQVGVYNTDKTLKAFIVPLSSDEPIKLRISNNTTSALYVWSIITRTTNPALLDIPTVGAASNINSTSFYANWSAVVNATGYKVFVYKGTSLVKTVEASGQTTSGIEVSELDAETEYSYKVLALGDDYVNHADSYVSVASASFSTGPATALENLNKTNLVIKNNMIETSEIGSFEIYNLQGIKVNSVADSRSIALNLHSGLYIVCFTTTNGEQLIKKFNIK